MALIDAFGRWLSEAPLWLIAIVAMIAMAIAAVIGHRLRLQMERTTPPKEKRVGSAEGQEGYVVSGVLSLLALLMGFTYGLAVDRFETRRTLVLQEANAIGTAYLRTQLLEEPDRTRISSLLVAYTDNRIALALASPNTVRPLLTINDALIRNIWRATAAAFPGVRGLDFSSAYLDSMNKVIDLDASRKVARLTRVPAEVFFMLFVYVIIAAGVLGYVLCGYHGRAAASFLFLLFLMALILVIDIDRPNGGAVRESQMSMLLLRASMQASGAPPQ